MGSPRARGSSWRAHESRPIPGDRLTTGRHSDPIRASRDDAHRGVNLAASRECLSFSFVSRRFPEGSQPVAEGRAEATAPASLRLALATAHGGESTALRRRSITEEHPETTKRSPRDTGCTVKLTATTKPSILPGGKPARSRRLSEAIPPGYHRLSAHPGGMPDSRKSATPQHPSPLPSIFLQSPPSASPRAPLRRSVRFISATEKTRRANTRTK